MNCSTADTKYYIPLGNGHYFIHVVLTYTTKLYEKGGHSWKKPMILIL